MAYAHTGTERTGTVRCFPKIPIARASFIPQQQQQQNKKTIVSAPYHRRHFSLPSVSETTQLNETNSHTIHKPQRVNLEPVTHTHTKQKKKTRKGAKKKNQLTKQTSKQTWKLKIKKTKVTGFELERLWMSAHPLRCAAPRTVFSPGSLTLTKC